MLTNTLLVAAGSAIGGALRFLVAQLAAYLKWGSFPYATLIVNLVGCFFIMLVMTLVTLRGVPDQLRLFLTTGIMGGLTTYSTFDFETTKYFQDGRPGLAILYVGSTLVICMIAGLLGVLLARVFAE